MLENQASVIIISKVSGLLSMGGTAFMIQEILRSKKRLKKTYFRLMLGMAFIEFCDGLAFFLGSWMIPGPGFLATGNAATCTFQGFLLQASIGSTIYNANLAIYYLLSIKYDWSERLIRQKIEPWMHIIALCVGYGTAAAGAALDLYMSYGDVCYIGKFPNGCKETYEYGYTTCEHGDNSSLYLVFFYTIWAWSSIGITLLSMLMIWWHVRKHENKMATYSYDAPSRKHSKRFAKQGFLFVLVFYVSHFFATVTIYYVRSDRFNVFVFNFLRIMYGLLFPSEGFLNFLVYMRPRIIKKLKKRKERKRREEMQRNNRLSSSEVLDTKESQGKSVVDELEDDGNNDSPQEEENKNNDALDAVVDSKEEMDKNDMEEHDKKALGNKEEQEKEEAEEKVLEVGDESKKEIETSRTTETNNTTIHHDDESIRQQLQQELQHQQQQSRTPTSSSKTFFAILRHISRPILMINSSRSANSSRITNSSSRTSNSNKATMEELIEDEMEHSELDEY